MATERADGNSYRTLGVGKNAKTFWADVTEEGIAVFTGREGESTLFLSNREIDECLAHFKERGWFLLANTVDNLAPGGLGEYFKFTLKKGAKFASHFAAILVNKHRLEHRYRKHSSIELKVIAA